MESKAYVPAPFKCYPVTATRLSLDSLVYVHSSWFRNLL